MKEGPMMEMAREMAKKLGWALMMLLPLGMTACNRDAQYLYQSLKPPPVMDKINQNVKETLAGGAADILWVIDNSGSMDAHQQDVINNTQVFMDQFTKTAQLDWKMGLISTDASEKPFVGFTKTDLVTWQDPSAATVFQNAVNQMGTSGSGIEQSFIPLMVQLTAYPDFIRPFAQLVIVIVTDAPEQSDNLQEINGAFNRTVDPPEFIDFITKIKGDLNLVHTYGVFGAQDFNCPQTDDFWNFKGSRYEALINATRGKTYRLCDPDFGKLLTEMGKDIVQTVVTPRIQLKKRPVTSTIHVTFGGKDLPGGTLDQGGVWIYDFDLNSIIFNNLNFADTDPNADVTVTYREDNGIDYSQP